jgi:hypothetical protein
MRRPAFGMFSQPMLFDSQHAVMFDHEPSDTTRDGERTDDPRGEHHVMVPVCGRGDTAHEGDDTQRNGQQSWPAVDIDEGFTGMLVSGAEMVDGIVCVCHVSS